MLLTAVTIGLVTTGVVSGTSILLCRSQYVKRPLPAQLTPPLRFTVAHRPVSQSITVLDASTDHIVCEFQHSSSSKIVNNLYQVFGSVAIAHSDKEVAVLHRNTVGNGGYIEFWSHDFRQKSMLQSLFSRWQGVPNDQDRENSPLRIYISSKLVAGVCELEVHNSSTKYLWSAEDLVLYKVDGSTQRLAAKIDESSTRRGRQMKTILDDSPNLIVYNDIINPYLAVCTMLFFMLQTKRKKSC